MSHLEGRRGSKKLTGIVTANKANQSPYRPGDSFDGRTPPRHDSFGQDEERWRGGLPREDSLVELRAGGRVGRRDRRGDKARGRWSCDGQGGSQLQRDVESRF